MENIMNRKFVVAAENPLQMFDGQNAKLDQRIRPNWCLAHPKSHSHPIHHRANGNQTKFVAMI